MPEAMLWTMLWILTVPAVLAALLIFLIFPARRRHPDRKLFEGKFIAHRGLHGGEAPALEEARDNEGGYAERGYAVPENSLTAFRLAAEKGYPIETDIHITKDGKIAVFHDDTLDRMCGRPGKPEEFTLKDLRELTLAGTREHIPSFEELLETVDGRVPLLIEFKCVDAEHCEKLCRAAVPVLDTYKGKYAIQSFYPFVQRWFKKNRPEVMRGQLASGFYKDGPVKFLLGTLMFNIFARPDFVSYNMDNRGNVFFRLSVLLGAMPFGWTFRTREEFERGRKAYKAYIFENETTVADNG